MLNHLAWGLLFVVSGVSLEAQSWPGVTIPSLEELKASDASAYSYTYRLSSSDRLKNQVWSKGGLLYAYSAEGRFKEINYSLEPAIASSRFRYLPERRLKEEVFTSGELPVLPRFITEWGLNWNSSLEEWQKALKTQTQFEAEGARPISKLFQDGSQTHERPLDRHRILSNSVRLTSKEDPRSVIQLNFNLIDETRPTTPFALSSLALLFTPGGTGKLSYDSTDDILFDDEKRGALALSALLIEQNRGVHESLESYPLKTIDIEAEKKVLSRDWGIESREDLLAMLSSLDKGLHGAAYQDLVDLLAQNSGVEPWRLADSLRFSAAKSSRLLFVAATRSTLGPQGIRAWDEGRRVALARWGYEVGFLSEQEAWDLILFTWNKLKGCYASWGDYFYHYLAGRAYWASSFENEFAKTNQALLAWSGLVWNSKGIWNKAWPRSEEVSTPDHSPFDYLYNPTPEAHSLYDVLESESFSVDAADSRQKAWQRLLWAWNRTPEFHAVTHALVSFHLRFKETTEALDVALTASRLRPELSRAWLDWGQASMAAGDFKSAAEGFSQAVALDAQYFDALEGLSRVALEANEYAAALIYLEKARVATPAPTVNEDPNFFLRLVFVLNRLQKAAEAVPVVDSLLQKFPQAAAVWYEAGFCYYYLGREHWPRARDAFLKAKEGGVVLSPSVERWVEAFSDL